MEALGFQHVLSTRLKKMIRWDPVESFSQAFIDLLKLPPMLECILVFYRIQRRSRRSKWLNRFLSLTTRCFWWYSVRCSTSGFYSFFVVEPSDTRKDNRPFITCVPPLFSTFSCCTDGICSTTSWPSTDLRSNVIQFHRASSFYSLAILQLNHQLGYAYSFVWIDSSRCITCIRPGLAVRRMF